MTENNMTENLGPRALAARANKTETVTAMGDVSRQQQTAMSAAVQASATARILARHQVALTHPRDLSRVETDLLSQCRMYDFADEARYALPRKKGQETTFIRGFTIRFAEAALRAMGNMDVNVETVADDDNARHIIVTIADLETNTVFTRPITVPKVVERKYLKRGQAALGQRVNSYGDTVHLVPATGADVDQMQAAAISKAIRSEGLRLVPPDIRALCEAACNKAIEDGLADSVRVEKMLEWFQQNGADQESIEAYVGKRRAQFSPTDLTNLKGIAASIKDKRTTWAEIVAGADVPDDSAPGDTESPAANTEAVLAGKPPAKKPRKKKVEPVPADGEPEPVRHSPEQPKAEQSLQEIVLSVRKALIDTEIDNNALAKRCQAAGIDYTLPDAIKDGDVALAVLGQITAMVTERGDENG